MKVSDAEIRLAEWILKKCCTQNLAGCRTCPHASRCTAWGHEAIPEEWDIPEPLPEPLERPRIEWLRMLPDKEMLNVMDYSHFSLECADCYNSDSEGECLRKSDVEYCDAGHMDWWHEVVTLEQFRKDVWLE